MSKKMFIIVAIMFFAGSCSDKEYPNNVLEPKKSSNALIPCHVLLSRRVSATASVSDGFGSVDFCRFQSTEIDRNRQNRSRPTPTCEEAMGDIFSTNITSITGRLPDSSELGTSQF